MDYSTLVKQAKQYYSSNDKVEGGAYSIVDKKTKTRKKDPFYLKWCDECEEINLWTYWKVIRTKLQRYCCLVRIGLALGILKQVYLWRK